MSSKTKVQ